MGFCCCLRTSVYFPFNLFCIWSPMILRMTVNKFQIHLILFPLKSLWYWDGGHKCEARRVSPFERLVSFSLQHIYLAYLWSFFPPFIWLVLSHNYVHPSHWWGSSSRTASQCLYELSHLSDLKKFSSLSAEQEFTSRLFGTGTELWGSSSLASFLSQGVSNT